MGLVSQSRRFGAVSLIFKAFYDSAVLFRYYVCSKYQAPLAK